MLSSLILILGLAGNPAEADQPAQRGRDFQFIYSGSITGLAPGQKAHVWLPVPVSNEDQQVKIVSRELPAEAMLGREKDYGNEMLSFEAAADQSGAIPFKVVYRVIRREVHGAAAAPAGNATGNGLLLKPSPLVPIDGKPIELIKDKNLPADPFAQARVLYETVNNHMRYSKEGTGWGRGDAVWACDSRFGNCSDFHSLFMSLARSRQIPAVFEIGFPLPEKRGAGDIPGYHCWAKFFIDGKGWVPVDISEANKNPQMKDYYFGNLTENRVAFSTGRDLTLVPKQAGPPLNFFVYPYAEVDGKAYPGDKIKTKYSFKDE